jgi:hypothetical protein
MPPDLPPPAGFPPLSDETIADVTLGDFVAGDLAPAEAAAVRTRAATDPDLAARIARAERLEATLRSDGLLPVPVALVGRVLAGVRAERPPWSRPAAVSQSPGPMLSRGNRGARAAAALVLACAGAWTALGGAAPVAALADVLAEPVPYELGLPASVVGPLDRLPTLQAQSIPWPALAIPWPALAIPWPALAIPWPDLAVDERATRAADALPVGPGALAALAVAALAGAFWTARRSSASDARRHSASDARRGPAPDARA